MSDENTKLMEKANEYCMSMLSEAEQVTWKLLDAYNIVNNDGFVDCDVIDKLERERKDIVSKTEGSIHSLVYYVNQSFVEKSCIDKAKLKVKLNGFFVNSSFAEYIATNTGLKVNTKIYDAKINIRNIGIETWDPNNIKILVTIFNDDLFESVSSYFSPVSTNFNTGDEVVFMAPSGITTPSNRGIYSVKYSLTTGMPEQEILSYTHTGLNIVDSEEVQIK